MEPIRFRCSSCNQLLRVGADKAGRTVRCNRCHSAVAAPTAQGAGDETDAGAAPTAPPRGKTHERPPPPPVEPHERPPEEGAPEGDDEWEVVEDEPRALSPAEKRRQRRREAADAWRHARRGAGLLLLGAALSAGSGVIGWFIILVLGMVVGVWGAIVAVLAGSLLVWVGVTVVHAVGLGLCARAPAVSGARPFALVALVSTVLTHALLGVSFWAEARRAVSMVGSLEEQARENEELLREKKFSELSKRNLARSKDLLDDARSSLLRWRLVSLFTSFISGIYLLSVPNMLRAFCQSLGLKELGPNCDTLLKLGAGTLGLSLAMQVLGVILLRFAMMLGTISGMLHLAWQVVFLITLWQIYKAMPRRKERR